ncbi:unnamed protein product [Vicia faba]|uniref:Uncharacterized protein n=1 Tax=Vicia faba TaxID=3906 RepID=A0AAV1ACM8_VICFA|nr:unnamed protein product [Vicia faba]
MMSDDDISLEWIGYYTSIFKVIHPTSLATVPENNVDRYLEWYNRVSNPRLVPPPRDSIRVVLISAYEVEPSDPALARVSTLIHCYLRQNEDDSHDLQFADLFKALRISRYG